MRVCARERGRERGSERVRLPMVGWPQLRQRPLPPFVVEFECACVCVRVSVCVCVLWGLDTDQLLLLRCLVTVACTLSSTWSDLSPPLPPPLPPRQPSWPSWPRNSCFDIFNLFILAFFSCLLWRSCGKLSDVNHTWVCLCAQKIKANLIRSQVQNMNTINLNIN